MRDIVYKIALSTYSLRDIHALRQTCQWIHDLIPCLPPNYKEMLVTTCLQQAMHMQHDEKGFARLLQWMKDNNVYLAGGFVLQSVLGETWNDGGDIDFFYWCESKEDFRKQMDLMFNEVLDLHDLCVRQNPHISEEDIETHAKEAEEEYLSLQRRGYDLVIRHTLTSNHRLKIDHISVFPTVGWSVLKRKHKRRKRWYSNFPEFIYNTFDLSVCMTYFGGHEQQMDTVSWKDVLNKEVSIRNHDERTEDRKKKYERRGFKFLDAPEDPNSTEL